MWKPHPGPQHDFCECMAFEVLYGGAAGGGKTDCLIMEALRHVDKPRYKGVILRRTFPQLQEILDRTREYYPEMGGSYLAGEHRWYFPSGASIQLGHLQNAGDEYNYQGKEFQYIAFDEACQFLPQQYLYLFSRCRSTDSGIPTQIRAASNPGGVGHQFFKDRFQIGVTAPRTRIKDPDTGLDRVFIPAMLQDNPSLTENDPNYVQRLMMLPEIERLRLMEGVWDAFEGQTFSELNQDLHGFDEELPFEWECFGAFDWGYSKPWAYGLWRVDFDGCLWLDRMLYGCRENHPDTGLKQTDGEIARQIRELEQGMPKVKFRSADPSIFNPRRSKDNILGPSVAEEMSREGIFFVKADNNRVMGWQQVHHRLRVDDDGKAQVVFRRSLKDFWRTMVLMRDDPKIDGDLVTKDSEDHIADMVRYACMTRPIRPKHIPRMDTGSFQAERRKLIAAKNHARRFGVSLADAYGRMR